MEASLLNRFLCRTSSDTMTGAHERDRTADLVLTKDVLCQLSYVSRILSSVFPRRKTHPGIRQALERETGLEPATPSLEGWCSSHLSYSREKLPNPSRVQDAVSRIVPGLLGRVAASSCHGSDHGSGGAAGGERRIRTSVGQGQQIYSLPRLTASVSLLEVARFADRAGCSPNPSMPIDSHSRRAGLPRPRWAACSWRRLKAIR